jgi:hypothetical protein
MYIRSEPAKCIKKELCAIEGAQTAVTSEQKKKTVIAERL